MASKTHMEDIRLHNNAGMSFPVCYAGARLLDLDKAHLPITSNQKEVTCSHCKRAFAKRYSWALKSILGWR